MKETSTRELALAWWNNLKDLDFTDMFVETKCSYTMHHFGHERNYNSLTGREIEEIWKNQLPLAEREFYYGLYKESEKEYIFKLNQKQFKELNPELHLKHLNKFSMFDKFEITSLNILQLPLTVDELDSIVKTLKACRDRNKITK